MSEYIQNQALWDDSRGIELRITREGLERGVRLSIGKVDVDSGINRQTIRIDDVDLDLVLQNITAAFQESVAARERQLKGR